MLWQASLSKENCVGPVFVTTDFREASGKGGCGFQVSILALHSFSLMAMSRATKSCVVIIICDQEGVSPAKMSRGVSVSLLFPDNTQHFPDIFPPNENLLE